MRCLVCNENGVIVLCFRYKSTVREIAFQRGWSLVVCRTFRDSWLFRGGFAPGCLTIRDMEHYRGRFGLGEWNRPRNRPVVWKVDIAEEAAFAMGLCGSLL